MARVSSNSAFLNVPYDKRFRDLYLAFIAGLSAFGLVPRATLETPGGERRLDRIVKLIRTCRYSFHDLSRVQLNRKPPPTPRFNMPFELGLVLGWLKTTKKGNHTWFVFEAMERRLPKSLSDLDGTDPYVHGGTVDGVFHQLCNALVKSRYQPNVEQMNAIYQDLYAASFLIQADVGAESVFEASVFRRLVVLAQKYAQLTIPGL